MSEINTASGADSWLIRTAMNEILGPISRADLISQIQEGKLGPQDEVCRASSYWIYLDEREEVKRQLGIELPQTPKSSDDSTETEIQTTTRDLTQPSPEGRTREIDAQLVGDAESDGGDGQGDGTKVLQSRRRDGRARWDRRGGGYEGQLVQPKPLILGNVERPSFWRVVVLGLIALTGVLVAWVIRILQTAR